MTFFLCYDLDFDEEGLKLKRIEGAESVLVGWSPPSTVMPMSV